MTGAPLTLDELEDQLAWVGRVPAVALFFDLWAAGRVPADVFRAALPGVWTAAEWPEHLNRLMWVGWFRTAAYPPPSGPMALYRGAAPRYARGMAWTTDPEQAAWFANRWQLTTQRPAHVYTATVAPVGILAVMDDLEPDGRAEHEVVVDPSYLPRPVQRANAHTSRIASG